jgi:hypothetical protein
MIPIMPWCTLGDPLTYITGSYHKATAFVIENNVSLLEYIINIVWQEKLSLIKQTWYFIWWVSGDFFCGYVEPPKEHEGLQHLFT